MAGGSVNRVILVGNLVRDPESRATQSGAKIVNMTLATSENWKDASGERKEKSEFHKVVVFNDRIADVAERYLKKGAKIYVEGQIQTRQYTDQQGNEKYTTEVVIGRFNGQLTMLGSASDGQAESGDYGKRPSALARPAARPAAAAAAVARQAAPARSGGPSWDEPADDLNEPVPF